MDDKTAEKTADELSSHLQQFKIESKVEIITTDNASALKRAFKDTIWIPYSAHNLSLAHEQGNPNTKNQLACLIQVNDQA